MFNDPNVALWGAIVAFATFTSYAVSKLLRRLLARVIVFGSVGTVCLVIAIGLASGPNPSQWAQTLQQMTTDLTQKNQSTFSAFR